MTDPDKIAWAVGACTLIGVWARWGRHWFPRFRAGWKRFIGFFDAIAGRAPVIDNMTGEELHPEVLPLGKRLALIDTRMDKLVTLIESNQNAHHRIDAVEQRVEVLEAVSGHALAENWRAGADAALAAVEKTNASVIDVEATEQESE